MHSKSIYIHSQNIGDESKTPRWYELKDEKEQGEGMIQFT